VRDRVAQQRVHAWLAHGQLAWLVRGQPAWHVRGSWRGSRKRRLDFGDETFARNFFTAQFGEATQQVALFSAQLGRYLNEHSCPQVATTA